MCVYISTCKIKRFWILVVNPFLFALKIRSLSQDFVWWFYQLIAISTISLAKWEFCAKRNINSFVFVNKPVVIQLLSLSMLYHSHPFQKSPGKPFCYSYSAESDWLVQFEWFDEHQWCVASYCNANMFRCRCSELHYSSNLRVSLLTLLIRLKMTKVFQYFFCFNLTRLNVQYEIIYSISNI